MKEIGGKKMILYIIYNVKVCRSDDFSCKGFFAFQKIQKFFHSAKSADDPFNFEKIENFCHSAEIEGYGSGVVVV